MEIISRKQAFSEGKTRFYTGRPCKHGHDCERYTSMGGCIMCINGKSKPWVIPKLNRGSQIPAENPRACQFLIEMPFGSTPQQHKDFVRWMQHACAPQFFAALGLKYAAPVTSRDDLNNVNVKSEPDRSAS